MEQHGQNPGYREGPAGGDRLEVCENRGDLPACYSGSMLSKLRRSRLGRQFAGWGFMALGVAGIILPILPGWIFIALGAVTLAPDVPFFARLLDRVAHHVPPLRNAIERVRGVPESRLSLREGTSFRGAKGDEGAAQ